MLDSLVVIGLAVASLGTVHDSDGPQRHGFWLLNAGRDTTVLHQGYTSCGCTQIAFDRETRLAPGDSTLVTLSFNPRGKVGPFYESGTILYGDRRRRVEMALEGECVTSEETLLRVFPVRLSEHTRLSADRFDLGRMRRGTSREVRVMVLHRDEDNRREPLSVVFRADSSMASGHNQVVRTLVVNEKGKALSFNITFDVFIQ